MPRSPAASVPVDDAPKSDRVRAVARVAIDCSAATHGTHVKQANKEECDINRIMARYVKTGVINFGRDVRSGRYADLTSAGDYKACMDRLISAQLAFNDLPSKIRSAFGNDPARFLEWTASPDWEATGRAMGIIDKTPEPPPNPPGAGSAPGGTPGAAPAGAGATKAP